MKRAQPSIDLTQVTEWNDGNMRRIDDYLAAEEPLEIRINGRPTAVTMRTPGNDVELAAGFVWTEGLIDVPDQIVSLKQTSVEPGAKENLVEVELRGDLFQPEEMRRNFFAASSCGICGKATIEAIRNRGLSVCVRTALSPD